MRNVCPHRWAQKGKIDMFRLDTAFVNLEGYYWLQKEHIDKVNNLPQTIDFLKLRLPTSMQECVPANIKKWNKGPQSTPRTQSAKKQRPPPRSLPLSW